ncbi:hypothetical protein TIFTF001_033074 [Ficus carica]|uniref:Uncharacterized protein n=1 Tax=Ficus carica TaxID=3494 RepID=A0AA88E4L7_FICCA|nr:hypothetical protein TIFTF001_033074 [Ficus carica]
MTTTMIAAEAEAAYFLGQKALPPPNSFHFSQGQGLWLDLQGTCNSCISIRWIS